MQDKKHTYVDKIFEALQEYLKLESIQELAEYFNIPAGTMYAWKKRGKIANSGLILGKCKEIELEWLETGEGPMLSTDQPPPRSANQTITGKQSIIAGRSIIGNGQSVNVAQGDQLDLDADEQRLILLSREVGGKLMVRKFINELERLKKDIEARF